MDVVVKVRVPEGVDEVAVGEIAEIFARAQALKMLAVRGQGPKREKASWGSFVSTLRSTATFLDSSILVNLLFETLREFPSSMS